MTLKDFIPPRLFLYFSLLILGAVGFFLALILSRPFGFYIFVVIAALGGLIIAITVYYVKKNKKQLVCPTGSDCNAVITSRYSKFLGISLEYLGMAYFTLVLLTYLIMILFPQIFPTFFQTIILMFTIGAFLFSSYLLFIQAFLLRQWCIWCVLASTFSIIIFLFSLVSLEAAISFLTNIETAIIFLQSLGFVLGMGTATAACFLFTKFITDFHIDNKEEDALTNTSQLIWLGIFLVLLSQLALFVAAPEVLGRSNNFIIKSVSIIVVAISTAILMIIFAPLLPLIPFEKGELKDETLAPFRSLRKPAFITGAIALISWYFSFSANYLPEYSLIKFFVIYLVLIFLAVLLGLLYERKFSGQTK